MSRYRIAALAAVFTIASTVAAHPPAAEALTVPPIRMTWPAPGSVVNVGTLLTAEVDHEIPRSLIRGVDFELSNDGGQSYHVFGGPSPDGLREFQALWDAGNASSGAYQIRATMRVGVRALPLEPPLEVVPIELVQLGLISSAPITVRVNTQPVSWAQATLMQPMQRQALIRFQGQGMDPDGTIRSYAWDFEDGSPIDPNPTTTHVYPVPGHFTLSLKVTDDLGGVDTGHFELTTTQIPTFPFVSISMIRKVKCKCKSMDIKTGGAVEGPAGFNFSPEASSGIPPAQAGNLGPYNDGAAGGPPPTLPGAGPWNVQCRFEVIAELEPFSDPALCPEGQRVQRTAELGTTKYHKTGLISPDARNDRTQVPGAVTGECRYGRIPYCDDDYHGGGSPDGHGRPGKNPPNGYKTYEGQKRIMWLDAPGLTEITAADLAAGGAYYDAKFEAKVGECKCTWEVHIVINRAGQIIQNEVTNEVCS